METKINFNSEDLLFNYTSDHCQDCELCCFNRESVAACDGCPLRDGFYFSRKPQELKSSCMSLDDKNRVSSIILDLKSITSQLEDSLRVGHVSDFTISMVKQYLYCSLSDLDDIKSFD